LTERQTENPRVGGSIDSDRPKPILTLRAASLSIGPPLATKLTNEADQRSGVAQRSSLRRLRESTGESLSFQ